jgi:hypothetical protein
MNNEINVWWEGLDDFWRKIIIANSSVIKSLYPIEYSITTKNKLEEICNCVYAISISKHKELFIPNLKFLKNLRKLNISNVEKIEYDNLKFNKNLHEVELWLVPVKDLEFLSGNLNLKKLNLFSTLIDNLEPIKDCINLEELRFCEHYLDTEIRINDITPILNLEKLKILHVGKDVKKIESLKSLINLEEFSYITMHSLNFLTDNINLKEIFVMGNPPRSHFNNLNGFEKLEKLEILDISYSNVKSLKELDNLKNLKEVIIKETPIDIENKNLLKKIFSKTEVSRFKSKNRAIIKSSR